MEARLGELIERSETGKMPLLRRENGVPVIPPDAQHLSSGYDVSCSRTRILLGACRLNRTCGTNAIAYRRCMYYSNRMLAMLKLLDILSYRHLMS